MLLSRMLFRNRNFKNICKISSKNFYSLYTYFKSLKLFKKMNFSSKNFEADVVPANPLDLCMQLRHA